MTTQSRIAVFLSTSALCLGLAAAPSAFAAQNDAPAKAGAAKHHKTHAHKAGARTPAPAVNK